MKEILKLHENEKKYIQRIEDLFQRLKEQQQEIKLLKEEKNK